MPLFFYGEDNWRKQKKITALKERFIREEDPARLNVAIFDPGDLEEETLASKLLASPFLARKRLVIVKNLLSGSRRKDSIKLFMQTLERLGKATTLVVSEDIGKPKRPKDWKNAEMKAAWEYLEKGTVCEEFQLLGGAKLEAVIAAQAKARELVMSADAVALLGLMCAGDLGQAEQELQKLEAYKKIPSPLRGEGQGEGVITAEDVKTVCIAQGEANIFEFLDALGSKDQKALLRTFEEQAEENEPTHLLSRLAEHTRALLALKLKGEKGGQALKLHPFKARKIMEQIHNWDLPALKHFLFKLLTLEYAIKTGRAADPKTQLTALLARESVKGV